MFLARVNLTKVFPAKGARLFSAKKRKDPVPKTSTSRENSSKTSKAETVNRLVDLAPSLIRLAEKEMQNMENFNKENSAPTIKFQKISNDAIAPTRGSNLAAGYDLYSTEEYVIEAQDKCLCDTGLKIALPTGYYGRIAPRSGLASKHFIDTGAGVVDEDYRGPVKVLLFNHGKEAYKVAKGDRIAQLICERICYPVLQEVQNLDDTERGEGGFGSSGKN